MFTQHSAHAASSSGDCERLTPRQRILLVGILSLGLALRLAFFVYALNTSGYRWEDPDGYMTQALRLARPDGWRWTFDAVTYQIRGQMHALPPGYSVFLSFFAKFPGFPLSAQVGQIVLAAAAIGLLFELGRVLHSARAGLIAAAGYALWVPNIFNVWSTSQETLYIPLILAALVVLGRAMADRDRAGWFAAAGALFGVAALTRSMPLFFIGPAAAAHVLMAPDRRRAAIQAGTMLLGFVLITGPYSAALSRHFGQLTIIDTHGSIHVDAAGSTGRRAPGLIETARGLVNEVAADPWAYFADSVSRARSLFHVNGGRILQIYIVAEAKWRAAVWKALVHLGADALLILSATLAALGAVLARQRRMAMMLVLWAAVNIAIASAGGFSGARLRAPFEPILVVLAAIVFAGGWRRPGIGGTIAAVSTGLLVAAAVVPQVPRSLEAWPDYGVRWPSIFNRGVGTFNETAGLNVLATNGVAVVMVRPLARAAHELDVRVGGVHVRTLRLTIQQPSTIRVMWPRGGLAFVELATRDPEGPGSYTVRVSPNVQ